jgi:hypothetical protein
VRPALQLEIAQDEMEIGDGRRAAHLVHVDEPLAASRGLRRQGDVRQRGDDLRGQVKRVDQRVLRLARMDRDAFHAHVRLVRGERLVDDLTELGAVQRVRDVGLQVAREIRVNASANLLIRRERDPDRSMGQLRMLQQMMRDGHDDGDAGLIIRAQQRRSAGRDDVVTDLRAQVRKPRRRQHHVRGIGQLDVAAA